MSNSEILGWVFNGLSLLILIATIYYLNQSLRAVERQQQTQLRAGFSEGWEPVDAALLQYPELNEIWAGLDGTDLLREATVKPGELAGLYRQRAFVSLVFDAYFRSFKMRQEIAKSVGGLPLEEVRLGHPAFKRMWFKAGVRDDLVLFPEYVDLVERCFLAEDIDPTT